MEKRKNYLIDRKFQTKVITVVVLLIIGAIVVSGVLAYAITINLEKKSDLQLYGTTSGDINDMIMITSLFIVKPVVVRSLLTGGILSIVTAAVLMFFYSHRLAGPLYHLEKHLEEIIKGNYNKKLFFRKNDEFKQLADAINKLQDIWRTTGPAVISMA